MNATIADIAAAINTSRQWDTEPRRQFRIEEILAEEIDTDDEDDGFEFVLPHHSRQRNRKG